MGMRGQLRRWLDIYCHGPWSPGWENDHFRYCVEIISKGTILKCACQLFFSGHVPLNWTIGREKGKDLVTCCGAQSPRAKAEITLGEISPVMFIRSSNVHSQPHDFHGRFFDIFRESNDYQRPSKLGLVLIRMPAQRQNHDRFCLSHQFNLSQPLE